MKRFLFLISIMFVALAMSAQTKPTEVSPDAYLSGEAYTYLFGTTSDTITNASATSFVFRVKGTKVQDFDIKLYSDWVSGTAGGTLIPYKSIDGVNYASTGDTITIAGVTADTMATGLIQIGDFNQPYLKITYTQTGTAVTVPKVYLYSKFN